MGRVSQQSSLGRKRIIQFWRTLAIGFFVFVLPPMLVSSSIIHSHPWLFRAGTWSLSAFYWLVAAALIIWVWRRKRDARRGEMESTDATQTMSKAYNVWVTLGMIGPAYVVGMFLFALFFSDWTLSSRYIPKTEAQRIISERKDARFTVCQYRDGSRSLNIALPENHRIDLMTFWDDSFVSALTGKGITYQTLIEDQDFHNGGVRGWLVLLSTFIVVAGSALLLRRPGTQKFYQQEITTPRAEKREKNIIAVCAALALIAMSLMLVVFTIAHGARSISGAEARTMIRQNKSARFEVLQYDNGSKELWITLPQSRTYPSFTASADESTLALLAEKKISYGTIFQGRDFGHREPGRGLLLLCISVLAAGATCLLWRVVRKNRTLPAPAESHV